MGALRLPLRAYIAAVMLAASAAGVIASMDWRIPTHATLLAGGMLLLMASVAQVWPLSDHPTLLPRGEAFVKRWGALAIFIGRFFGPLRASVPLVAGIFRMPFVSFQIANFTSAFVWAAVLLTLGDVVAKLFRWMFGE